jgi:hypothetical protein
MIATRLQQKNIAASTKNHQLPIKTSPSPNKTLQTTNTSKNRRHTWFGGRSNVDETLPQQHQYNNNNNSTTFRPQTPNHKVSVGRSFADRLIRTVSPTRKARYETAGSAYPMTTTTTAAAAAAAALTTVKPVVVNSHVRSRSRNSLFPDSRDDDHHYDQENNGSIISNNAPPLTTSSPIHELNDRLARIEQRLLFEQEHVRSYTTGGHPQKHHRHQQQQQRSTPPQRQRVVKQSPHYNSPPLRYHYWDPPSTSSNSTPTPTLFAHTKKMVEQEKEQIGVSTWPSSEEDDDEEDNDRRRSSSKDQKRRRHSSAPSFGSNDILKHSKKDKTTKNNDNDKPKSASSHQTPRHLQRSKQKEQPKIHHATVQRQESADDEDDEEELYGTQIDGMRDETSVSSLPPTPKMSNFQSNMALNSKEKPNSEAKIVDLPEEPEETSDEQQQPEQQPDPEADQPKQDKTPSIDEAVLQPREPTPPSPIRPTISSRFALPTIPCTTAPRDVAAMEEDANSILATQSAPVNHPASASLMDNAITGVLSDLSSSTNGNADGVTTHSQNTHFGKDSLTVRDKASSILFSKMNCTIPVDPSAGPMENMRKMCAGEESGSQSNVRGDRRRSDDTLTTYLAVANIPREIPLVPGRSTPDISLMDHPDHESVSEEEVTPSKSPAENQSRPLSETLSPLRLVENAGQRTQQQQDRDLPPKHNPASPQRLIPIIPNASKEEDNADAQEYWESMYLEVNNTHDVLQDLLQTPTNQMEPEAAAAERASIEIPIDTFEKKSRSSPWHQTSPRDHGRRVLFTAFQKGDGANKNIRPLVPKRNSGQKSFTRPGVNIPGKDCLESAPKTAPKPKRSTKKKNGMVLASSVDSISNQLKTDEMERQKKAEESRRVPRAAEISQAEPMERKTVPMPPSAIIREHKTTLQQKQGRQSSYHPHTGVGPNNKVLTIPQSSGRDQRQRQHEADAAMVDILHLHNRSLPIGKVQKYKLSPYHPKPDNLSKNHWGWFGRKKPDDKITFAGSSRESKGSKGGHSLEAMASSAGSTITGETTEGIRRGRKEIVESSNQGSGSYHSLERSQGDSAASSDMSYTVTSNSNASEASEGNEASQDNGNARSSIPRATTYDEIIQDLKKFESQLPIAEFAVVEVGDDSDAEQAHTYLMNRGYVENELRSGADKDEPLLVEMPFGLETIAELSLEESFSMGMNSDVEDSGRAKDDSKMDNVKLSVSFAEQLQKLQSSHRHMTLEPTSPGKAYHI